MDAIQLSANIQAAVAAQFPDFEPGQPEVFPSVYFNSNVVVIAPDGRTTPRAPRYCGTVLGAGQIAAVLNGSGRPHLICVFVKWGPSLVLLPAMGYDPKGGWSDSELVPYVQFAQDKDNPAGPFTGPAVNAGILLDYFNHGYPPYQALNLCQLEVLDAFARQGLIKPLTDEEKSAIMAQKE